VFFVPFVVHLFLTIGEEEGAHGFEVEGGLGVVVGAAEVLPVAGEGEAEDFFAGGEELFDEVGEVEGLGVGDVVEDARFEDVDAHGDVVVEGGLFDVVADAGADGEVDDAEVDFDVALVHGDGGEGAVVAVELEEVGDGEGGEDISVGDEEGGVEAGDEGEGAGGAEGAVFVGVGDGEAEAGAVLEEGAEELGEVADGEDGFGDAGALELVEEDFEDGHVADGHEGLGEDAGVGGEASALAAGEDDGFHRILDFRFLILD
jgi:hypothetical protein